MGQFTTHVPCSHLLVSNRVLRSVDRTEVFSERDLSLFANLVSGLGVWYHLYHPTLRDMEYTTLTENV